MLKNIIKAGTIIICALLLHKTSFAADEIQLPTEELAKESVLPVFDRSISVRNRNIITSKKWDASLFYSYAMTEPIANVSKLGLSFYYNTSEDRAFGLVYAKNFPGLSSYAEQLNSQYSLDFSRAPEPQNTILLDYNIKAFYGKMSLGKSMVFNTTFLGSLAGGVIQYDHKVFPAIAAGIGAKFYFNKSVSLRFDMRFFIYEAPIPFFKARSVGGIQTGLESNKAKPKHDLFDERVSYTTTLDVGVSVLF